MTKVVSISSFMCVDWMVVYLIEPVNARAHTPNLFHNDYLRRSTDGAANSSIFTNFIPPFFSWDIVIITKAHNKICIAQVFIFCLGINMSKHTTWLDYTRVWKGVCSTRLVFVFTISLVDFCKCHEDMPHPCNFDISIPFYYICRYLNNRMLFSINVGLSVMLSISVFHIWS